MQELVKMAMPCLSEDETKEYVSIIIENIYDKMKHKIAKHIIGIGFVAVVAIIAAYIAQSYISLKGGVDIICSICLVLNFMWVVDMHRSTKEKEESIRIMKIISQWSWFIVFVGIYEYRVMARGMSNWEMYAIAPMLPVILVIMAYRCLDAMHMYAGFISEIEDNKKSCIDRIEKIPLSELKNQNFPLFGDISSRIWFEEIP